MPRGLTLLGPNEILHRQSRKQQIVHQCNGRRSASESSRLLGLGRLLCLLQLLLWLRCQDLQGCHGLRVCSSCLHIVHSMMVAWQELCCCTHTRALYMPCMAYTNVGFAGMLSRVKTAATQQICCASTQLHAGCSADCYRQQWHPQEPTGKDAQAHLQGLHGLVQAHQGCQGGVGSTPRLLRQGGCQGAPDLAEALGALLDKAPAVERGGFHDRPVGPPLRQLGMHLLRQPST